MIRMPPPGPQKSAPPSSEPPAPRVYTAEEIDSIYREHAPRVFRQALRSAGQREVAEDITSDTFLTLYRAPERLAESRLLPWLLTVARNLAMDHWRRRAVEERHLQTVAEPVAAPDTGEVESLFADPALKPEHRACLLLRYQHGLERMEIAARLGMTENQVKSALQYGLVILRRSLEGGKP
jgi:RNA polymerase sigma-70 factor, ECF subfamily